MNRARRYEAAWAVMLAVALTLAWLAVCALAAPAPKPKPPAVPCIQPGAYTMLWHTHHVRTYFRGGPTSGTFHELWIDGSWWEGTWTCKDGTLSVEEWRVDDPEWKLRWTVKLSSPTKGTGPGVADWGLAPLEEKGGGA
jgi:hypothetical protein